MRNIISYEDITEPPSAPMGPPPSKKRKKDSGKSQAFRQETEDDTEPDEMSRELSHEEIWDDSALIRAWDAANAEYEAYHGPDKGWKRTPVESSPLWYNTPPQQSQHPKKTQKDQKANRNSKNNSSTTTQDSQPIDFDTFIPSHDPSLSETAEETENPDHTGEEGRQYPEFPFGSLSNPFSSSEGVSRDQAFQYAMNAMYWTGYWSAIYHTQSQSKSEPNTEKDELFGDPSYGDDDPSNALESMEEDMEEEDPGVIEQDFLPTQR